MKTLLIIDAQNDFVLENGALPVKGALEDMKNLINFIKEEKPDKIVITMDSHKDGHIATAVYWHDENGRAPLPFTGISYDDAAAGKWIANIDPQNAVQYLKDLEAKGKTHTIWPEHCIDGTVGWRLYAPLADAVEGWLYETGGELAVHKKGSELNTEMFSAVMPEVSRNEADRRNAERFLGLFEGSKKIYVAGEAENFCVKETVNDIVNMRPDLAKKMHILRACMSPIPMGDDIDAHWQAMKEKGLNIIER